MAGGGITVAPAGGQHHLAALPRAGQSGLGLGLSVLCHMAVTNKTGLGIHIVS